MGKKKNKGFSLVEVIVVMVIIAILTIISVPMYRISTRKAMAEEGKALVMAVAAEEKIYFADHLQYIDVGIGSAIVSESYTLDLDVDGLAGDICVDAQANIYFNTFRVWAEDGNQTFRVRAFGAGDATLIIVEYDSDPPVGGGTAGVVDTEPAITVTGL